jgi:hypothetical protein
MAKVTIQADNIFVDGKMVGKITGAGKECYVYIQEYYVARFKYLAAKANAKDWIKFILQHYTPEQLVEIFKTTDVTPLKLAQKHGYVNLNIRKYEAEKSAWRKDMGAYLINYEMRPERFPKTSCSQCGREFGPGNHGFSDCSHHTYL